MDQNGINLTEYKEDNNEDNNVEDNNGDDSAIIPDMELYLECTDDDQYQIPQKPPQSEHILIGQNLQWRVSFPVPTHPDSEHLKKKEFTCQICDKIFKSEMRLHGHMQRDHGERKPFLCDQPSCTFRTNTIKNLRSHLNRQHSSTSKKCGVIINKQSELQKISTQDETSLPKVFRCYPCAKHFSCSSALHRHFRLLHSDVSRSVPSAKMSETLMVREKENAIANSREDSPTHSEPPDTIHLEIYVQEEQPKSQESDIV